MIAYSTIS